MKNDIRLEYSNLWNKRHLISAIIVSLIILALFFEDITSLEKEKIMGTLFIYSGFMLIILMTLFQERNIAKRVIIQKSIVVKLLFGRTVKIEKNDIIRARKISKKTINNFGVREMVIDLKDGSSIHIPINIKRFEMIELFLEDCNYEKF